MPHDPYRVAALAAHYPLTIRELVLDLGGANAALMRDTEQQRKIADAAQNLHAVMAVDWAIKLLDTARAQMNRELTGVADAAEEDSHLGTIPPEGKL